MEELKYGLPYMGSKNRLLPKLLDFLPSGDVFVDLFAGGCAVTHAAMLSGKYKRFIANDITDSVKTFKDAIDGKFRDERRVITREEFLALKDTDPYVRICWSFGNNQRDYLWGRDKADLKLISCRMLMSDDWHERRQLWLKFYAIIKKMWREREPIGGNFEQLERLQRLQSLQSLERLERLERLEIKAPFETYQGDYRDVEIPQGSVVYCDPPYEGTRGYLHDFNHAEFWEWVRTRDFPVYVSEYKAPEDFVLVGSIKTNAILNSDRPCERMECVFVHKRFAGMQETPKRKRLEQTDLFKESA